MTHLSFSVCIPNYNYADYIGGTIQSVLAQDYADFEIVVADNASTDDSVRVVRSFASERVRLIENRYNIGFSANLDRATESACKDFMILLSSDDLMRPGALATYAAVLEHLGARAARAVLTSAVDVIDAQGRLTGIMFRPQGSLFYRQVGPDQAEQPALAMREVDEVQGHFALAESLRRKDSPAAFLSTCYSRELYRRVEGYHNCQRIWPDSHFLNKVLAEDATLVYVPQRLFAYRVHDSNQLAGEAKAGALTYQVDAYMHTVEFPQSVLEAIGVSRLELQRVFIEKAVAERGLQAIAAGNRSRAFKCLAFGFATYPGLALRQKKTLALAALLAAGPFGSRLARWLHARHRRRAESRAL